MTKEMAPARASILDKRSPIGVEIALDPYIVTTKQAQRAAR